MKLSLAISPHNPSKLCLYGTGIEEPLVTRIDPAEFTTPIQTVVGVDGIPPDRLIVQALKIAAGVPDGFASWEDANTFMDGIEDAVAFAQASGHDLSSLLT